MVVNHIQRPAPEEWVVVVVQEDEEAAELLALTRVHSGYVYGAMYVMVAYMCVLTHMYSTNALCCRRRSATLSVAIPDDVPVNKALELTMYIMSACYLGLDQTIKVSVPILA